jgi:kanamycin nucleotidyltransferase
MKHAERMQLARDLCDRMVFRYPGDVVISGVYGSTANGTDTPWSDLELLFVVRDGSKIKEKHFIYRGIAVGYSVFERQKLRNLLANPSPDWPFLMGVLSVLKVLYGDLEQVQAWLRLGQSVSAKKFREALEACLPELVVESYGRIYSCRERGNTQDIGCAVIEVLFEMNTALCLLNQRWVTHDYYNGFLDKFSFPKLPEGYQDLVPALWNARDIDEIVPLAEMLVSNFWQLLANEGIEVSDYQTVDDLPL